MGASAGRVLLISKGDWNSGTTYTGLDWVRHNGASWVCKNTCTNIEPTLENAENWQMMARDGDSVTADTVMSSTSTNAVQNKVIKSYVDNSIAGIADMTGATSTENGTHGLVPAPQAGDEKKVLLGDGTWVTIDDKISFAYHDTATSGTSFTDAEDGNMIVTDWTRNLFNPTLGTTTVNGVTCTNNGDGTYTLNGTPTTNTEISIGTINIIDNTQYKIVGCPKQDNRNFYLFTYYKMHPSYVSAEDSGNGYIFTAVEDHSSEVYIGIVSGFTCDNLTFKPMITTDLSATYDDFVPYGGYEIKSCGKNLLNPTLEATTINGVTCTNNGDGTYTFNGTATDAIFPTLQKIKLDVGKYKMCGCPKTGSTVTYKLNLYSSSWDLIAVDIGQGKVVDITEEGIYFISLYTYRDVELNNVIIKPMITTDLDATYDTFEKYQGESIIVTNDTESPVFGLKSHKGITNIISSGNVKFVYPTNESGKGVLDAMYNNELSKLKNAIFTYSTKNEYDTAVANDKIPDGATVIKDYDD